MVELNLKELERKNMREVETFKSVQLWVLSKVSLCQRNPPIQTKPVFLKLESPGTLA